MKLTQGQSCTDVNALMDYDKKSVDLWSRCSIEFFTDNYNNIVASQGSFCMGPGSEFKSCCHIPFPHPFTALQCVFEVGQNKMNSSKTLLSVENAWLSGMCKCALLQNAVYKCVNCTALHFQSTYVGLVWLAHTNVSTLKTQYKDVDIYENRNWQLGFKGYKTL